MAEEPRPLQLHPLWSSCNLNDVVKCLQPREQDELPSSPNSSTVRTKVAFPGPSISCLPRSEIGQSNGVHRLLQSLPPYLGNSCSTPDLIMKESQGALSHGISVKATPNTASCSLLHGIGVKATPDTASGSLSHGIGVKASPNTAFGGCQKKFLVFDCSGNETRSIVSPFLSSPTQNQITIATTSLDACNMRDGSVEKEKISAMKLINLEKVDENNIIDEESEMHEDTEEINALLYSDDSDQDDDIIDGEDDEVTSTGHSPVGIKGFYD